MSPASHQRARQPLLQKLFNSSRSLHSRSLFRRGEATFLNFANFNIGLAFFENARQQ